MQQQPEEVGVVAGMTHEGEGVVREGKTAFVAGALAGERIRFRRVRRHKQHDDGALLEVLEPARDRVVPRCPHFGLCGGCALQHLDPASQIAGKQRELQENIERIAKVTPDEWLEPMRGPEWNYRRRARLGVKYVAKKGRVLVGFRERLAPYVAELRQCEVLSEPTGRLITPLADMIMTLSIRERLPQIEVAIADNAVALVMRVMEPPSESDLETLRAFEREHGLRLYLQPKGLDSVRRLEAGADSGVAGGEEGHASMDGSPPGSPARATDSPPSDRLVRPGEAPLHYKLPAFDLTLNFNPTDFIQVNGTMNAALVSRAIELLRPEPGGRVLDLYCGLGNFTLALARAVGPRGQVVGVEGDRELVRRGGENARLNGISNAEFHMADLMQPLPSGATWSSPAPAGAHSRFPHVLLDPPRAGAREMLPTVARLAPKRVLYISCHPGSLARDIGLMVHEHGFRLRAAGVLDMFPHTTHVESLAVLEPAGRSGI
jgi:23S rRNA (uracil1939-C5)-methyltransferase